MSTRPTNPPPDAPSWLVAVDHETGTIVAREGPFRDADRLEFERAKLRLAWPLPRYSIWLRLE